MQDSCNNVDAKVDTPDGRNTFHGTVCEPIHLKPVVENLLKDVPETVVHLHPCRISGNTKPYTSPKYQHYTLGQHAQELDKEQCHDRSWLLARYMQRSGDNTDSESEQQIAKTVQSKMLQPMPLWCAYNSVLVRNEHDDLPVDYSHSLPIINNPAHDLSTLVTAFMAL